MTKVESIRPNTLPEALELLLATPSHLADTQQVRNYRDYLDQGPLNWEGLQISHGGRVRGVFFAMLLPGRSAIVMTAVPGRHGIEPDDQLEVLQRGLEQLEPRKLHYAQALIEPAEPELRHLIERAGLRHLTRLHYLQRNASYPWASPPQEHEADWINFGACTYDSFVRTLAETYRDSLDCAELTGLRPIHDVIASHQATRACRVATPRPVGCGRSSHDGATGSPPSMATRPLPAADLRGPRLQPERQRPPRRNRRPPAGW